VGPVRTAGSWNLTTYLLDSTVLIEWLRGRPEIEATMLHLVGDGHSLGITCVNLAEVEAGLRQRERQAAATVLGRLRFLSTEREAAHRAGRYQDEWAGRGITIQMPDALVAGTARAHDAVLVTHNADDFPMSDVQVVHPREAASAPVGPRGAHAQPRPSVRRK
jgi:predicted nucleic acid-binding protein